MRLPGSIAKLYKLTKAKGHHLIRTRQLPIFVQKSFWYELIRIMEDFRIHVCRIQIGYDLGTLRYVETFDGRVV